MAARYQIRTPADQVIDDVIGLMAARAKEVLEAWDVFDTKLSVQDYDRFRKEIRNILLPYVKSYKLCGVSSICLDQTRSTSLSPESHVLDANPQDMVYQLFPRKDLEDFLDELATRSCESLKPLLKPDTEQGVFSTLRLVFRCVLGDYLYFNPLCGHTELCTCSVAARSSPWWHRGGPQR